MEAIYTQHRKDSFASKEAPIYNLLHNNNKSVSPLLKQTNKEVTEDVILLSGLIFYSFAVLEI